MLHDDIIGAKVTDPTGKVCLFGTGCTIKIQSLYFLSYTAPDDVISNLIPDSICWIFTLSYEVSFVPINYPKVVQKSQNKNQLINAMHVDLAGCK